MGKTKFTAEAIKNLKVGGMIWDDGVGCRKQKDGNVAWYIKYFSREFGPKKEAIENCPGLSYARRIRDERRSQIFLGRYAPGKSGRAIKFGEFVDQFLEMKSALKTAKKYRQQLDKSVLPYFGSMPLKTITRGDCLSYYSKRQADGAALATCNNEMNLLKGFFSAAMAHDHIDFNPARGIKLRQPHNRKERILSRQQTQFAFEAADEASIKERTIGHEWLRPLFFVLYFTGKRVSEACSLMWEDIDFEIGTITSKKTKAGHQHKQPMHPVLSSELLRWKIQSNAKSSKGWVFTNQKSGGNPITRSTVAGNKADEKKGLRATGWHRLVEIYNAKCKASGIEPGSITPHDLRRNFTSQFANAGVNALIIRDLVGHKTMAMTARYTSLELDSMRKALAHLPAPAPSTQVAQTNVEYTNQARPDVQQDSLETLRNSFDDS